MSRFLFKPKVYSSGGGGEGRGEAPRSGTEKRCSHNLQSGQSAGLSAVFQGGGMFSYDFNFGFERWISREFRILSPPAKSYNGGISESANFFRMFDYFALGKSLKIGRNSISWEM